MLAQETSLEEQVFLEGLLEYNIIGVSRHEKKKIQGPKNISIFRISTHFKKFSFIFTRLNHIW